ncbi:YciI family protein [Mucilaginibacter aquariorum]|uniref:YciI family protein n=1 Tax=Mucilaginibacter aquariorum TaxID=2967225 RepID=A0ABT1T3Z8_9SPHI|nr:YciI family protein [Mucilaginibacter aquariorum]MCQ6959340.1 YciI family protein [Mucilaginibacter aquariorum]
MKDFLFVFRNDFENIPKGSPEELQALTKKWMDWVGGIAAQNKLSDRGSSLASGGKVVRPNNVVTDGPYTEIKELIGGYTIVKADSIDEAVELASGCPVFNYGGNVEVREINVM